MCVGLCVCSWIDSQRRDLIFRIFICVRVSRRTLLSILARRPHEGLCPRKSARLKEKDEGRWSIRSKTSKQRVRNLSLRRGSDQSALRRGSRSVGG